MAVKKTHKKKKTSRSRKSKKNRSALGYLGLGLKYIGVGVGYGVYYTAKGVVAGGKWAVKKAIKGSEERNTTRLAKEIDKNRPEAKPSYGAFKEIENMDGAFSDFEKHMIQGKSTIGIILGARGTGKSAIGVRILENLKAKTNKKIYALGFDKSRMPRWIHVVDDVNDVANDSFLLADEGGLQFSSRDSMSEVNKFLSQLLLVARHKDMSILFISQNSSNIEINTLRQADYLILKRSSLLQEDFERKKIKDIYESVKEKFKKHKSDKGITFIYSDNYRGFVSNPLPSFWNQDISKSYKGFKKR